MHVKQLKLSINMRNKFTELIEQGVASFNYTNISKDIPEQDPICRMYNNIFSIPSDTHMSCLEDGTRVITGHMIATDKWEKFCMSCCWGAVEFRTSGVWSVFDFLFSNNLEGRVGVLNGDVVYIVTPMSKESREAVMKNTVVTTESNIPQPITVLTTTGNMMHIQECFESKNLIEIVKRLNESSYVKGNNWVPSNNGIVGLVGNTTYVIKNVNEGKDNKHQIYTMSTIEHNGMMRLTVWDWQSDRCSVYDIADTGKVVSDNSKSGERFLDDLDKNIKGFDWTADLKLDYGYSVSCDLRLPDGKLNYIHEGPWYIEAYKGYEVDTHYGLGGGLKKRRR